jgi:hypothetical protein
MMWIKRVVTALCLAFSSPAAAQVGDVNVSGPYVHVQSGVTFPTVVGDFRRVSVRRYLADGSNEGIGYNHSSQHIAATVFIYPSPVLAANASADERAQACAVQLQSVQQEITTVHANAVLADFGETVLTQNGAEERGRNVSYRVTAPSRFGPNHPPLRSEAHLFCYVAGAWTIKYRFTYEDDARPREAVAAFLREFPWIAEPAAQAP